MTTRYFLDEFGKLLLDDVGQPIPDMSVYDLPTTVETAGDIITAALRESNLIALGDKASGMQAVEGLQILNRMLAAVLGFEVGENVIDWPTYDTVSPSPRWDHPCVNSRVLFTAGAPTTVYLPTNLDNGARISIVDSGLGFANNPITIDAGTRRFSPTNQSTLMLTRNNSVKTFLYRADIAQWVLVNDIGMFDPLPYPADCSDFFITRLAMRLNPRYGRSADPALVETANRALSQLRARYRQIGHTRADKALILGMRGRSLSGGLALDGDEYK